jgi:hypothetical protein
MIRSAVLAAALFAALAPTTALSQKAERRAAVVVPAALPVQEPRPSAPLVTSVTLADLGFVTGLRFSNLGGRREIFVPLPQGADLAASELVLAIWKSWSMTGAQRPSRSTAKAPGGRSASRSRAPRPAPASSS